MGQQFDPARVDGLRRWAEAQLAKAEVSYGPQLSRQLLEIIQDLCIFCGFLNDDRQSLNQHLEDAEIELGVRNNRVDKLERKLQQDNMAKAAEKAKRQPLLVD